MDFATITQLVQSHSPFIVTASATAVILMLILLCIVIIRMGALKRRFERLMKGGDGGSIERLILEYGQRIEKLEEENTALSKRLAVLTTAQRNCIQKLGMVRYNAYQNSGYDMSFSLAVLNGNKDGVVVSSLFGRNECIVYAKPLKAGSSEYTLSMEEQEAVDKAI